ncbi:MAG: recombinase RecQ [Bdellovibrionales bacterium RIFCSPHIGHO2_01_FULL_40_29]|nr:MAG: recombinase RecQ [Bdellovibrionales bacterium RIFCSPHIGHO2_01_FULL_40_29]OFZ33874.1 MAG: recombinase RecQ [Bdellovibrionales bacterium RIFCSPHIGHO2_02_FULL_40_15]
MLESALKKSFSLSKFRIGQQDIIEAILAKKDSLAVLPTGGGKSLCYQFPAVYLQQLVVVVSPLIALMKDQVYNLMNRGIPAGSLYSGQSDEEKRAIFAQINQGGTYILYLSPERVQKEGFQKWILDKKIALFAIDEAHCVSQWGHDFREEYAGLRILKSLRPDVPVLALTASATPVVLDDIAKNLQLVDPTRMVHGFYRPNLYYQVQTCADESEKSRWLEQSLNQTPHGRILIYCGTRKITEEVSRVLESRYEKVGFYHAGLSTSDRTTIQTNFAVGNLRILVATNAFGMGIDQPDVRLVVHYQMPANIDSLYQEMGRAGRDGAHSTCLLLYSKKDKGLQSFFIQNSTAGKAIKNLRWKNLDALVSYCEAGECRHSEILTYYRDSQRLKKCGHCDTCDPQSSRIVQEPVIQIKAYSKKKQLQKFNDNLDAESEMRFQKLRNWRKAKATELDVPAFVIFGDRTLRELAEVNPRNLDQIRSIHGIGETKLEKFGWDLLAELT